MKYIRELPGDIWVETGIALELPHSALAWLESRAGDSNALALATQYSSDGLYWRYDHPAIGARQRVLLLRKPGHIGMRATDEIIECWPARWIHSEDGKLTCAAPSVRLALRRGDER